MTEFTRRRLLGALGSTAAVATAGCGGDGGGNDDGTTTAETTAGDTTTATTTAPTTTETTTTAPTTTQGAATMVSTSTHPDHGLILVDGQGLTLYRFAPDTAGTSTCTGTCADNWPPLTTEGDPQGTNLLGELGTLEREDGSRQVTYEGWPLYYFANDQAPGDATGHGLNDAWFVVPPDVEPAPADGDGTTTAEPTTTTTEPAMTTTTTTQASLPSQVTVDLANTAFSPIQAEVAVGGTVEWVNEDGFSHDVTSDQFSDGAASWSKATTLAGGESTTHTFDSAGFYEYYCTIHGDTNMCGVVVVGEGTEYTGSLPCQ